MDLLYPLSGLASMGAVLAVARRGWRRRTPTTHFPDTPAVLAVRRRKTPQEVEVEQISLRTLIETHCPSLFTDFRPPWWLFNGHLQTLYSVLGDFSKTDPISYERKYIRLMDGGTLGLDFTPPTAVANLADDVPIIVVKHGLTGGSYESYVRAILHHACAAVEQGGLGYRAVVINFRGCAGVPVTSPQLYSAGHTHDLRQALMFISHLYPKAPLVGIGFSLGANVMTRYLAEEGPKSRLLAGCVLGCPWDLAKNNSGLNNSIIGKNVYSKGMGGNLVNMLKRHADVLSVDPEHAVAKAASLTLKLKNPTIDQFDGNMTCIAGGSAPHFPFDTAEDYYRWASSHHVLKDIRVPFLAINAADDPVVHHVPVDGGGNGHVIISLTPGGGHLGWFQPGPGPFLDRWTTKPVLEWFKVMAEQVSHHAKDMPARLYIDDDGFLKEEGKNLLGCKETEGGIIINGLGGGGGGVLQGL